MGTSLRPASTPATSCPSCMPSFTTASLAPSTLRWRGTGPGNQGKIEHLRQGSDSRTGPRTKVLALEVLLVVAPLAHLVLELVDLPGCKSSPSSSEIATSILAVWERPQD